MAWPGTYSEVPPDRDTRDALAKRYPEFLPLEEFPDDHLARIMAEVRSPICPDREFRVLLGWLPKRSYTEWHWFRGIDPFARRPDLPKWLRAAVVERDGNVCQICTGTVEPGDMHLDHIYPRSRGGRDVLDNLQVTHSTCNMRKAAKV